MGKFESSISSKSFDTAPPLREFDVPDESEPSARHESKTSYNINKDFQSKLDDMDNDEELSRKEQEFREARQAKRSGKERLNDGAKRRIEMLIGMSRLNRSVELDGNNYVLQILKAKEMRESFIETAKFDGTIGSSYEMRKQLVGRSLSKIANYDIEQFLGSDSLETRLAFIDELPESLLSRLFAEYQLLVKESSDKYSIKDDADAKEVLEDLKK